MKSLVADPAKCTGAMRCMPACSLQIFKVNDVAWSALRVRRADGAYEFTICDQCGDCIPICPTQALQRNRAGVVQVKKDLCTGCFMCVAYCPKSAMFRGPGATEPFKCLSCNACVKACPSGALRLEVRDHSNLPR